MLFNINNKILASKTIKTKSVVFKQYVSCFYKYAKEILKMLEVNNALK